MDSNLVNMNHDEKDECIKQITDPPKLKAFNTIIHMLDTANFYKRKSHPSLVLSDLRPETKLVWDLR